MRGNRVGVIGEMDPAGVIRPAIDLGKTCRHRQAQYAQEQTPKLCHGLITPPSESLQVCEPLLYTTVEILNVTAA